MPPLLSVRRFFSHITAKIPNAKSADFDKWPKSLKDIATQLGTAAR